MTQKEKLDLLMEDYTERKEKEEEQRLKKQQRHENKIIWLHTIAMFLFIFVLICATVLSIVGEICHWCSVKGGGIVSAVMCGLFACALIFVLCFYYNMEE